MKKSYPYLQDYIFLDKLYTQHNQTTYAQITVLDWYERPLQEVQGRVLSASISLNGDSSVRRTANMSIKILDYDEIYTNIDSLFSINKKIFVESGIKNNLRHLGQDYYPNNEIIWFPLGLYVITGCSVTHDSSGVTLSLQLTDKMCLLNGTAGGIIPASANFESYDTLGPDGDLHTEYIKINQMIPEIVNHFGGEDLNNILVIDVPNRIKKVLRWISSNELFLYQNKTNFKDCFYTSIQANTVNPNYNRTGFTYGMDCGYSYGDFVYPEELAAGAGDSVCTVLDKIKNKLGNYEYFYDVFGTFIFQEIKNYVNTTEWRTAFLDYEVDKDIKLPYAYNRVLNSHVYDFSDKDIVVSYSNSPNYEMIKNDFIVWGMRKTETDQTLPCRYHLAIDDRPTLDEDWNITEILTEGVCFDTHMDDFIRRAHPINEHFKSLSDLESKYPKGITGKYYLITNENAIYSWTTNIEQYKNCLSNYQTSANKSIPMVSGQAGTAGYVKLDLATYFKGDNAFVVDKDTDWRNILYWKGVIASHTGTDTGYYWAELYSEWPKLFDVENGRYYEDKISNPSGFDWWLDIIDDDSDLNKFSVQNIGRRSYAKTDSSCNCVFEPLIPNVVMVDMTDPEHIIDIRSGISAQELQEYGLIPVQVNSAIINSTALGGIFNSCYEHVKQIIQDHIDYNESISITCLPLYHLEPNTRIHLDDPESGIYGDYIINNISYSLGNGNTMSLSAKKVNEKI